LNYQICQAHRKYNLKKRKVAITLCFREILTEAVSFSIKRWKTHLSVIVALHGPKQTNLTQARKGKAELEVEGGSLMAPTGFLLSQTW
jgi:hypothetical protein